MSYNQFQSHLKKAGDYANISLEWAKYKTSFKEEKNEPVQSLNTQMKTASLPSVIHTRLDTILENDDVDVDTSLFEHPTISTVIPITSRTSSSTENIIAKQEHDKKASTSRFPLHYINPTESSIKKNKTLK